jgi:cytochrome c-type biogenesis protein
MHWLYEWLPLIQKVVGYLLIILSIFIWMDWLEKGLGLLFAL